MTDALSLLQILLFKGVGDSHYCWRLINHQGIKSFFFHLDDMRKVLKEHYASEGVMEKSFGINIDVRGAGWRDHNIAKRNSREAWLSFVEDFRTRLASETCLCQKSRGQCFFCQSLYSEEWYKDEDEDEMCEDGFESIAHLLPGTPSWQVQKTHAGYRGK